MANSIAITDPKRKRFQFGVRTLLFMTAAVATILAAVGWFTGGWASGVEWSPDRFAHRSFRFYVMFGGSDPDLTPSAAIQRREWESDLETWLKQNGYVIETSAEPRWFLSKGFAPGIRGWSGPAKRVCQELGCWGGRSHNWIEWSEAHPDIAAELWPDFVKLVREENGRGMDAASFLLDNARDSKSQKEYRAAADRLIEMHARGLDP